MSEGVIDRLRWCASQFPNVPTSVYPGDVISSVDELRTRAEAELAEARAEIQHWRSIAETAESEINHLLELRETPGAELAQTQAERDLWRDRCGASTASAHARLARAERAEAELGLMTAAYDSQTLNLENARAEVERLRAQVMLLRTAVGYYVEAEIVTSWGMQESEDIGDVARDALAATS